VADVASDAGSRRLSVCYPKDFFSESLRCYCRLRRLRVEPGVQASGREKSEIG